MSYKKFCAVYIRHDRARIIVAPAINANGGMTVELGDPQTFEGFEDAPNIGRSVKVIFHSCEVREGVNISDRSARDWPAFIASNSRTLKDFTKNYCRILVSGSNESNITMTASVTDLGDHGLSMQTSISSFATEAEVSQMIEYLFNESRRYQNTEIA